MIPISEHDPNEFDSALNNPDLPKLYFNGFTDGVTNADVLLLLKQNNRPVAVCNMSLTIAKTLAIHLNNLILNFEANSGNEVMTTDVIDKGLSKMRNEQQ